MYVKFWILNGLLSGKYGTLNNNSQPNSLISSKHFLLGEMRSDILQIVDEPVR